LDLGIDPTILAEWNHLDEKASLEGDCSPVFPFTPASSATTIPFESLNLPGFPKHPPGELPFNPLFNGSYCETADSTLKPNVPFPSPSLLRSLAPKPDPDRPLRRGPGRPKKHEFKSQAFKAQKKQSHNQSASQSRARLNSVIDELWYLLPKEERSDRGVERGSESDGGARDKGRKVTRTQKIEDVIEYIKELQKEVGEIQAVEWRS
jgi:hypothetical protein